MRNVPHSRPVSRKRSATTIRARKVLIGALVLHHLETSNDQDFSKQLGEWLRRELPGFLTRDNDEALFADLIGLVQPGTAESGDSTQGAP